MLTRLVGSLGRCTGLGRAPRRLAELSRPESLRLLGSAPFGRIVYTIRALPAIVPVRHLVDDDMIVIRTHVGADCAGAVVAFQTDDIDPVAERGWSVTVTGVARRVVGAEETAHYESVLTPFVDMPNVEVIRIYPELIAGYELVSAT
jgi:Pyridoxamine 5'-phosphate oxidase